MRVLATASAGTNRLLAEECGDLGLRPKRVPAHGVELDLDWPDIAKALVHLRIAQRVLIYIDRFPCSSAASLYDGVASIDWSRFVDPGQKIAIGATGPLPKKPPKRRKDGQITNHVFASQKVKDAICDQFRDKICKRPSVDIKNPDVRFVARFVGDAVQMWLDPCGAALHRRGYRPQTVVAPLRETLAAALLRFGQWRPDQPLHDPMCGSGTILVEAAEMALQLAAGRNRTFGAQTWRHEGAELGALIHAEQQAAQARQQDVVRGVELDITGGDIDPRAIAIGNATLAKAGLAGAVRLEEADATRLHGLAAGTLLASNPPYGERIGGDDVVDLYASLGASWRRLQGCDAVLIDGHERFRHTFGMRWENSLQWSNGPLAVHVRRYHLGRENTRAPQGDDKGRRRRPKNRKNRGKSGK